MKYLYSLALLLVLISCQDEKKQNPVDGAKTDRAFYKLEGNAKSISEKSYEAFNDSGKKGSTKHEIASSHDTDLFFNDRGLLVLEKKWLNSTTPFEETKFNGREYMLTKVQYINGKVGIKTENSRDKAGNITGIIRRNGDNTQLDRVAMTYSGKNLTEKKTFSNRDSPNDRIDYTYDRNGNLKGESMYLNTEYVQVKTLYEYDSQNRKTAETRYNKDNLLYKTTFGYEGKNLVKKETTDENGAIKAREKSSYDKNGNLTEHSAIDSYDNSQTLENYKYDSKGNIISLTVTRNNQPEMQITYNYDGHNNITSAKTADSTGIIVDDRIYAYEYDEKGNWIKKTVTVNGQPLVIVEREITYFANEE